MTEELAKHLLAARRKDEQAQVFAFHDDRARELPAELQIGESKWRIVRAPSELAVRAALVDRREGELLAIVTPLNQRDLGKDVRARIATNSLLKFDRWASLLPLFEATSIDGRLRRNDALGRALLRCATSSGFPKSQTGMLHADEAWAAYFTHALGMGEEPTELDGWVQWLSDHPNEAATLITDEGLFDHVKDRARARCGPAADLVFQATAKAIEDGVDIGTRLHALAHGVSAAFRAASSPVAQKFFVRLEDYFGRRELRTEELRAFADEVLRTRVDGANLAAALDSLLRREHAEELAELSDVSPLGYRARRKRLATSCGGHLDGDVSRDTLIESLATLERHALFDREEAAHRNRVRSLVRLVTRMAVAGETDHASHAGTLAREYVEQQSFLDALREQLEQGDLGNDFADVVSRVLGLALEHSTERNARFARSVAKALGETGAVSGAFFVHDMIRTVLAPLAKARPVLVLVIDGLSWFVLRQIADDPQFDRWLALAPSREGRLVPMLATVPSITQYSRTSLLTGSLQTGHQTTERNGFAAEPHLVGAIGNKHKAVLFHKAELDEKGRGNVGSAVADAIRTPKYRAVGVVVNAVDDQLSGAPQLAFEWTVDTVAPLRSLLELADETGRDVLIVSDHGHIWDGGTSVGTKGTSARYREEKPAAADGEVLVSGPMIEASGQGKQLVAAYDESVRYTGGQRGYHGGVSLQELVAPCLLLTTADAPDGERWIPLSLAKPAWWDFRPAEEAVTHQPTPRSPTTPKTSQLSLIEDAAAPAQAAGWIDDFLASSVLASRRKTTPGQFEADQLATIFATLQANHWRAHVSTLAQATSKSTASFRRSIPMLQRLLNVEGFIVLDYERAEDFVRLDHDLLVRQFLIEGEA